MLNNFQEVIIIFFSILITTVLIYYHWAAMLITHLTIRKTSMPFRTIEDLYYNTNFRISLLPNSAQEDDFAQSADPMFQKIYSERIKPHLQEYSAYPIQSIKDNINFIQNDYKTAVYTLYESAM